MNVRQIAEFRREERARDRALLRVLRVFVQRDLWLRARLYELHLRVLALEGGEPPGFPEWPPLAIPPELEGLLEETP
jgi:hypothetical protein